MKAQAPIERAAGPKIMPLDAHAQAIEIAPELPPAFGDALPRAALGLRFVARNHRANLTGVTGANASRVSLRLGPRGPSCLAWRLRHRCSEQTATAPCRVTRPCAPVRKGGRIP